MLQLFVSKFNHRVAKDKGGGRFGRIGGATLTYLVTMQMLTDNYTCGHNVDREMWTQCGQGDMDTMWTGRYGHNVDREMWKGRYGHNVDREMWTQCGQGDVDREIWTQCGEGDMDTMWRGRYGHNVDREMWTGRYGHNVDREMWTQCGQGDVDTMWTGICGHNVDREMRTQCGQGEATLNVALQSVWSTSGCTQTTFRIKISWRQQAPPLSLMTGSLVDACTMCAHTNHVHQHKIAVCVRPICLGIGLYHSIHVHIYRPIL